MPHPTRTKTETWKPRNLIYTGLSVIVVLIFGSKNLIREKSIFQAKSETNLVSPKPED